MGLMSPGGVHSHQEHIAALARIFSGAGLTVHVHAFLDGRDTPPQSAKGFVEEFEKQTHGLKGVAITTISGRYYAMDRDKRWDRVEKAYEAIVSAQGKHFASSNEAIQSSYAEKVTDEFVVPCIIGGYKGVADGDVLLFANFRPDRAREISLSLLDPKFEGFSR